MVSGLIHKKVSLKYFIAFNMPPPVSKIFSLSLTIVMSKSNLIRNAENLIHALLDSKLIQSDKEISDFFHLFSI